MFLVKVGSLDFGYLAYWTIIIMFVVGLCGLASLPFHPQWSRFLQYVYPICFSPEVSCFWSVLHVSHVSVNNIPTFSLLQFIFKNSASIFQKLYFLYRYKFLIRVLSPLLNGTLHHRYIVGAFEITHHLIFVWKLVQIVWDAKMIFAYVL